MKQKLLYITTVLILGCLTLTTVAQTPVKARTSPVKTKAATQKVYYQRRAVDTVKNTDFSLNGQYQFMLSRSKSINGYKLVNPTRLAAVWKSVTDTLRKERAELKTTKAKVTEQGKAIATLQAEVSGKNASLNSTTAKADEITFLGISFTKGNYHIIVWSIIGVLAIALFVVIARSAKNIIEAKHRTQLYEEISTEYQAYKVKTNEQQRKLARELQDERNIVEELRGRG